MAAPSLVEAFTTAPPCAHDCHATLTFAERTQGVAAMYRFDDALRGWGYQPSYEIGADRLFRAAKARNDPRYRVVAVRDDACVYRRLVGFAVHELIHALCGDVTLANFGIPFGAPYGVPEDVPPAEEKAWLAPHNAAEARAFVGVGPLARALYGVDWAVYTARDVGTYGFAGGRSLVEVPPGYRPVPHFDRQNEPERYYALARRLEAEATAWFTDTRLAELVARVEAAEALGRARAPRRPPPEQLAARPPRPPQPGDPCPCGSGARFRRCCGA